jgi:superfamily II DNA or RNA helicase
MSGNYIYTRYHNSYKLYNAVKLGITTCIGSRDLQYATSEIKRGLFTNVYKIINLSRIFPFHKNPLQQLEKLLQIHFTRLKKHIYIDGGTEFFNNDIISLIPEYLKSLGIEYVELTSEEIARLIVEYRLNDFYKKLSSSAREMIQLKLLEWLSRIRQNKMKPLLHQQVILDIISDFYRDNTIGKLYWACGLGKALLSLFIAKLLNAKNILFGVPSVYLQGQMKKEIQRLFTYITKTNQKHYILCIGGEDETSTTNIEIIKKFLANPNTLDIPQFVITTFDSCHILASLYSQLDSQNRCDFRFDFKIGDEAHHLVIHSNSDDLSNQSYVKFHDIPAHKTLFMTATPKIINYKKPVLEASIVDKIIYSMDDESQFGKLIDSKSIKWAIENKKITDFKVYVLYNTIHEMRAIARHSISQDKMNKMIDDKNMELFTAAFMTLKSLERHQDLTHILIYTNTTENSDLVAKYLLEILENQQLNIPKVSRADIYIKSLHSNSAGCKFEKEVENFTKAKIGIITCVYIFGEGFDLPRLNGVAMAENMISPIRTTQCALRPNRLDKNNPDKLAYIIIPYLDREECGICNQSFKKCFNVINSLRNDDNILECKIQVSSLIIDSDNEFLEQQDKIEESEKSNLEEPIRGLDEKENKTRNNSRITLKDNPLELEKLKLRLKHSTHLKRNESIEKDELEYMRLINRQLGITSREMYFDSSIRARFAYYNWIDKPADYFIKHRIWRGWYYYLGVDTSSYPATKEEWLEYCVCNGITNYEEYFEKQKKDSRLPEHPEELYRDFSNITVELENAKSSQSRRRRA